MVRGHVLVVEGIDVVRNVRETALKAAGYEVHAVSGLGAALEAIRKRTYHIAVVDLQLTERGVENRDGMQVIKALHLLGEGTRVVVVSGDSSLSDAIEAFEKWRISAWVSKMNTEKGELPSLLQAIEKASLEACVCETGSHRGFVEQLAGATPTPIWTARVLKLLGVSRGYSGLVALVERAFRPFAPLHPKDVDSPMELDVEKRVAYGDFWSKGLGEAIKIFLYHKGTDPDTFRDSEAPGRKVLKRETAHIGVLVLAVPGRSRNDYVDRI